jgi:hypothetical protein
VHAEPLAPQFCSLVLSRHVPESQQPAQTPPPQVHTPSMHRSLLPHPLPHRPQWRRSWRRSTQALSQLFLPPVHFFFFRFLASATSGDRCKRVKAATTMAVGVRRRRLMVAARVPLQRSRRLSAVFGTTIFRLAGWSDLRQVVMSCDASRAPSSGSRFAHRRCTRLCIALAETAPVPGTGTGTGFGRASGVRPARGGRRRPRGRGDWPHPACR